MVLYRSTALIVFFSIFATFVSFVKADETSLIEVPEGFHVSVYARDPMVRNPCAMAFDHQGRLFLGQGPQYRKPKPETKTDRVTLLIDTDDDGVADQAKTFARGFNNIQGLAWYGDQLWIANAPDLTVVRDIDGDDVADEYRRIYGGLGNLEHALHGLVFAPDGRLYMSKGNSKGYLDAKSRERFVAPAPFADLWGVRAPSDSPTSPETEVDSQVTYQSGYHTPSDDWGTEGGILRCLPDGSQLEIYSRGMRNMWDMNFDADFNWVGTDQDQDGGDRILNPFLGAHFGWGHAWSPHWTGENHLPSTPISGPVFHGSGTGVVSCATDRFPDRYSGAFFCADWLSRSIFVYRPKWEGAAMKNMEAPEVFAKAPRGRSMGSSTGMLFDPTDIEFGPDGALWVMSWGHGYGATMEDGKQVDEGCVYRISYGDAVTREPKKEKYNKAYGQWTVAELTADLRHNALPVRRTNAQVELVRRGASVRSDLVAAMSGEDLPAGAATWLTWTLGLIDTEDATIDEFLIGRVDDANLRLSERIQAIRVLGYRAGASRNPLPEVVRDATRDESPRIRFAAVQAIHARRDQADADSLWALLDTEPDRNTFYAARVALGQIVDTTSLRTKLDSGSDGQRLAALLTLLEKAALDGDEVLPLRLDSDPRVAAIASSFVTKVGTSKSPVLRIEPGDSNSAKSADKMDVRILTGDVPQGLHVRYTTDGSEPTDTTGKEYGGPFQIEPSNVVSAALFRQRERMGPVLHRSFASIAEAAPTEDITAPGTQTFPVNVTEVKLIDGRPYKTQSLAIGGRAYGNRTYRWKSLPDGMEGHTMIQPRNGDFDVGSKGDAFLSFTLSEDAEVYVAHDQRIADKPRWLSDFQPTDLTATTQDATYRMFVKRFPAGKVQLGGNTRDGVAAARSQYVTIVKPASLQPRDVATTITQSLDRMKTASYERGARLFFDQADCAKCHRMGTRGNAFAVNLTNLGTRADPKTIAESILKPSAVITEGFHSVAILTDEGRAYTGFIKQESGLSVDLVLADGNVVSIPRDSIEKRVRQETSVMPDGLDKLLSPQQIADIIRFIRDEGENPRLAAVTHDSGVAAKSNDETQKPAEKLDTASPITVEDNGDSLQIRCAGKDVATYVYRHDKVLRPFFAHVKAPSGTQVTRNFPPSKRDRKDHADMHPGIWMAFGDLGGEDFWRNKGTVVHKEFVRKPFGGPGSGGFSQRKSFQRADGSVVCLEDFSCTIRVLEEGYLLLFESTFSAVDGKEFYFGDQEEMGLGIRVATPITEMEGGQITDSRGRQGAKKVWSQSSAWCDYSGRIDGGPIGISIFCHPDNFRESWMHARNYGLIAANPFGRKAMNKGKPSRVVVRAGEPLRLRFGILLHGPTPDLDSIHQQFVRSFGGHVEK